MRVVLDTNVIVSSLLRPGSPPDQVVSAFFNERIAAVTSIALLAELEDVLFRPKIANRVGKPEAELRGFLDNFRESAAVAEPVETINVVTADPPDNRVLEAAVAGEAEYIVSGDRYLPELGAYEGIEIVTPAMFLALLAER